MNPGGFPMALKDLPDNMTGAPAEALASFWNREVGRAGDTIALRHSPLPERAKKPSWFIKEF